MTIKTGGRLLGAAALALAAPLAPATAQTKAASVDEALKAQADALLAATYPADAPGATAIVTRGGRTVYAGARGLADVEARTPLTADSVIRLGSITKQFAAALLLKLVEEGRVSLDDPVSRYVAGYPAPGGGATVRQLLNHTSGIQSYTGIPGWMVEANTGKSFTTAALIAEFRDRPAPTKPGEVWAYNNSGYVLVGAVIEAATGKPWHVALEERITRPLGLASIRYGGGAPAPTWAKPYTRGPDGAIRPAQKIDMSVPHAAGALVGSVRDLARWSRALHGGRVLKPATYRLMIAPTTLPGGKTEPYGFGLETRTLRGATAIAHGGGIFGGITDDIYLPKQDVFVAVFANTDAPPVRSQVIASRLAALAIGSPYPTLAAAPVDLAGLDGALGVYRLEGAPGGERRLYARDGKLFWKSPTGPERQLFAAGDDRYSFGPTDLDWFRLVRVTGAPPAIELHVDGEDTVVRAVRTGPIPNS